METLETERLILRDWRMSDLDDFYEYASNPNVGPSAGWEPHKSQDVSEEILKDFITENETWAIVHKTDNKVIGSLGVHNDGKRYGAKVKQLGYVLHEGYWGQGLIPEAIREVLRYLFIEQELDIVSVGHFPDNDRSRRVIEKCGFVYEGTIRYALPLPDGSISDERCYSMLRSEYLNL